MYSNNEQSYNTLSTPSQKPLHVNKFGKIGHPLLDSVFNSKDEIHGLTSTDDIYYYNLEDTLTLQEKIDLENKYNELNKIQNNVTEDFEKLLKERNNGVYIIS